MLGVRLLPEGAQSGMLWKEQWLGAQLPGSSSLHLEFEGLCLRTNVTLWSTCLDLSFLISKWVVKMLVLLAFHDRRW